MYFIHLKAEKTLNNGLADLPPVGLQEQHEGLHHRPAPCYPGTELLQLSGESS